MPKYIDADAFKEKYLCCGYLPEMSEKEFDGFPTADRLEELEERCARYTEEIAVLRQRQRWIPVTERLPEPETMVLVLDRYGHMMNRTMRQLPTDKTPLFRPDALMPGKHVTHWMPLPETPEVK